VTVIIEPVTKPLPEPAKAALASSPSVLGIVGSPRPGGNTDVLVSHMLEGAANAGATVERVFLEDLVIRDCIGCHACWNGKPCVRRDDMNTLFEKIAAASAFVFGTPIYWYGPTALMKAFIDRFVYFNCPGHREEVAGKPVALVIPYEEEDQAMADGTLQFFENSLRYLTMPLVGSVVAPGVTLRGEVAKKEDVMQEAYDLGKRLVGGIAG